MSEQAILVAQGLSKKYGSFDAVDRMDLRIERGMSYGLLGLNGAGKSTTIRMIMGSLIPSGGSLRVLGIDPCIDARALRERVGYVPDVAGFYEWMTIGQQIAFVAGYRKKRWDWDATTKMLRDFDLDRSQRIRGLSKGQRTRFSLLLALAFHPEFLVLDEPTGGLDPLMRRELLKTVLSEYLGDGNTILITSHLVNEISGLVDHVGIMKNGRLVQDGRVEEFLETTRRVRVVFENEAPPVTLGGMLTERRDGRELILAVRGFDEQRVREDLFPYAPLNVSVERLNLEDAVVEVMKAGKVAG